MKTQKILFLVLFFFSLHSNAQNCDPWISSIYQKLYGQSPMSEQCNIRNYNNGSWGSQPELVEYIVKFMNARSGNHLKGDPWIFRSIWELEARKPLPVELETRLYNAGSWGSYQELLGHVRAYRAKMKSENLGMTFGTLKSSNPQTNGKPAVAVWDAGKPNEAIGIMLVT